MTTHARYCVSQWHPTRSDCTCGDVETSERLSRLGQNLAMAGGLCKAYRLGASVLAIGSDAWRPGCREPAPGWEGQR